MSNQTTSVNAVEVRNVYKNYNEVEALQDLSLDFPKGELTSLLGPSGCGKSTLLRLIAGLEDVTGGQIHIDGKDSTQLAPAKRKLAMVFQSYALYPHMSVRNNIAFPLKMAKLGRDKINSKVTAAAEVLNLTDYLERPSLERFDRLDSTQCNNLW